jgi:hypothetical protein
MSQSGRSPQASSALGNRPDLQTPHNQRRLCGPRVCLDAVHGLFGQALGVGDDREAGAGGARQGGQNAVELLARVARLATKVRARRCAALMVDAGPLGGLGRLGLCLCRGCEWLSKSAQRWRRILVTRHCCPA